MNKYYGQRETDRYITEYFPDQSKGFCVEVGAYDGIKGSNTKFFEDIGWDCICIEPNRNIYPLLVQNRRGPNLMCACSNNCCTSVLNVVDFSSGIQSSLTSLNTDPRLLRDYKTAITKQSIQEVQTLTLDVIFTIFNIIEIDFISIDTEGTEIDVLMGLDLNKYRPKLLVIEENYEEDIHIKNYLLKYGYRFDQRFFVNNFYVRNK